MKDGCETDQYVCREYGMKIKRNVSGNIDEIVLLFPNENLPHHVIKKKDDQLIVEACKHFSSIVDNQWLYDIFDISVHSNNEIMLLFPNSKLVHHSIKLDGNKNIVVYPPIKKEIIDYID